MIFCSFTPLFLVNKKCNNAISNNFTFDPSIWPHNFLDFNMVFILNFHNMKSFLVNLFTCPCSGAITCEFPSSWSVTYYYYEWCKQGSSKEKMGIKNTRNMKSSRSWKPYVQHTMFYFKDTHICTSTKINLARGYFFSN